MIEISGKTGLYCLLGNPTSHSISPKMHNLSFNYHNLDYVYLAFDINPTYFDKTISGLKTMGVKGFNLTMPFKKSIIPLLDELSPIASLTNSVNTVEYKDGKLIGHSTDGIGFLQGLKINGLDIKDKNITILGAGGAATSIIASAAFNKCANIFIFKRKNETFNATVEYAKKISSATNCNVKVFDQNDDGILKEKISESQLLINATNVGMAPNIKESLVNKEFLHRNLFVADIIYNPAETKLLNDATSLGLKTMNGYPMLLFQGAEAFKIWTGKEMPYKYVAKECFNIDIS